MTVTYTKNKAEKMVAIMRKRGREEVGCSTRVTIDKDSEAVAPTIV